MWMEDTGYEAKIQSAWARRHRGTTMFRVALKIKECKKHLGEWSRSSFGSLKRQIELKRRQLHAAEADAQNGGDMLAVRTLRNDLNSLLKKEEMVWRQQSRVVWLKEGDRNMKFFHGRASQRWRRNTINVLRDENGTLHNNTNQVVAILIRYYENLFTTAQPNHIEEAMAHIPRVVSDTMNDSLLREFSACEVEQAIKQMAPSMSPGPDGMLHIFYKKNIGMS